MTTDADRRTQLRAFLASNFLLSKEEFPHADDASLLGEGVVDSTGVLELILFLEQTFGLQIEDHEATPRNLDSVLRILAFVDGKLGSAGR
ncbi:MAG: acyl carrier protein [Planctomycetes bacterium]|nr:acyl carrier protein [Planctomycetota bacterium]